MWTDLKTCRMAVLAGCLALPGVTAAGGLQALQELIAERRCNSYAPATAQQLQRAEAGFVNLLENPVIMTSDALRAWTEPGFTVTPVSAAGATWLVLRETPGHCKGQGLYLIRQGVAASLLLQVPHGYFDKHTDDIAAGLLQAPVRAVAFNTVPRHSTQHGRKVDADLAHRADNLFAAFTRAFARVYPAGRVVQLHGFNPAKRKTAAGHSAAVIVSAGTARATPASTAVAACLQSLLTAPVRLYPRDVRELGATTNLQGRLLREQAHTGFVHVELSRALRERLRSEASLRAGLGACLYNGMEQQ
jgi:mRNA-degrading endonuclease toxin of MazEF toxin-antitoxin module